MRKFYAFLAAALMSVSVFAAKDVVPSDAVLADYYDQGNVCVCFFVPADMNCNNIVLTGSFNGWSSIVADCLPVENVEGYDGWYVASFEPEAEPDAAKGIQAKPIMLDIDGNFNWEYQVGAATKIRGGVEIVAGYEGEIDLVNYSTDAPNVFTVDAWKQNPCTAIYHDYTVTVISDGCGGYVVPFIIGSMTGWNDNFVKFTMDGAKTREYQVPVYTTTFKAAENSPYQIVSGLMDSKGVVPAEGDSAPGWKDIAYMQKLVDEMWVRIPGEEGDNQLTHENAEIVWDLRAEDLRWARCDDSPIETVEVSVKLPAENFPVEGVEIIGTFDDWTGVAMEMDGDVYKATVEAKASQYFKFRSAGKWPGEEGGTEIEVYRSEIDDWTTIQNNELVFGQLWEGEEGARTLYIDLSDAEAYRWQAREEQGIENVVLTEKAHKVVVDGVIYIVRDNKLFNLQGAQVR